MTNKQIADYIKRESAKGFSSDKIKEALSKAGYKDEDVRKAIKEVEKLKEMKGQKTMPTKFLLIAGIVLLISTVSLILLLNIRWPVAKPVFENNSPFIALKLDELPDGYIIKSPSFGGPIPEGDYIIGNKSNAAKLLNEETLKTRGWRNGYRATYHNADEASTTRIIQNKVSVYSPKGAKESFEENKRSILSLDPVLLSLPAIGEKSISFSYIRNGTGIIQYTVLFVKNNVVSILNIYVTESDEAQIPGELMSLAQKIEQRIK